MGIKVTDLLETMLLQFCCTWGRMSSCFVGSFFGKKWVISVTSFQHSFSYNLRCQVLRCQYLFHTSADNFILTNSFNMSTTNRENVLVILWHNNQCNPGLYAAAVTILSCKQMMLLLEDTRWCLKLF